MSIYESLCVCVWTVWCERWQKWVYVVYGCHRAKNQIAYFVKNKLNVSIYYMVQLV